MDLKKMVGDLKTSISSGKIGVDKMLIILIVGIALIIFSLPANNESDEKEEIYTDSSANTSEITLTNEEYVRLLEERLNNMLSKIEGVGKVSTMITLKSSKEIIVMTENPYKESSITENDSGGGSRTTQEIEMSDTVIYIENSNGDKIPFVTKEVEPEIEGVLVVADGADNVKTATKIYNAIEALFGIESHKINVLEMNN